MAKTGLISPPKLKEIRQMLEKYLAVCDSKGILTRSAVATAAFREAKNQGDGQADLGRHAGLTETR